MTSPVYALILAAGKGTRMKSGRAKVLHEVFFAPMIHHVLDALQPLSHAGTFVVTGHQREAVESALAAYGPVFVHQEKQNGTGHAVLMAAPLLGSKKGTVLILCGDTPLIRSETLQHMLAAHESANGPLTVMTTKLAEPTGYGRIVTDKVGRVVEIVEEKDATPEQRAILEINAGIYCVESEFLFTALRQVGTDNKQSEMYLTDIVGIANKAGHQVNRYECGDCSEVLGVNSRVELAEAHAALQMRRNHQLMLAGVTLIHPETIAIEKTVVIGRDTVIQPNGQLSGRTVVGEGCQIESFVTLKDCRLANHVTIGSFSFLEGRTIAEGDTVSVHTISFCDK